MPSRIRQALEELPESLDGTYERTLQDINEANYQFAHRIFQCVVVASRPLRVEELAEFLAFDFNAGTIPAFRPSWRPVDPLDALLSTCSSLLAVENVEDSEVIQFSHFSVKEFLTSARLGSTRDRISRYYVSMTLAHTFVAQGCLGILLHLDEDITSDVLRDFHLAKYAAEHWADHVRFEGVSSKVQDGVKRLFDPTTRHLAVLVRIFDPRPSLSPRQQSTRPSQLRGNPLHYAACFGIHELIRFLVIDRSQDVNAEDDDKRTPLHLALKDVNFAQVLLEHGANVNAQDYYKSTPLHLALRGGHVELAQELIGHGADVNAQDNSKSTPLHLVSGGGQVEFARVLTERGANVNAQNNSESTPLHLALIGGHLELAQVLVKHGADVNAQNNSKSTPLRLALIGGHVEFAQVLVEHGADVNIQDNDKSTPLHLALTCGHVEFAQVLVKHGADVNAHDYYESTPLHLAFRHGHAEFAQLLIEHGAEVNIQDNSESTTLRLALTGRHVGFAQIPIKQDADVNAEDNSRSTPLHLASSGRHVAFAWMPVEHSADVNAQAYYKSISLYLASKGGHVGMVQVLLRLGRTQIYRILYDGYGSAIVRI